MDVFGRSESVPEESPIHYTESRSIVKSSISLNGKPRKYSIPVVLFLVKSYFVGRQPARVGKKLFFSAELTDIIVLYQGVHINTKMMVDI